ncbi:MAG TPA: aminotransferase class V-fold PLP-dependent enzyme [Bacteroidetes bacterium]|nr:aminotransferase class V-fold PLP-dependent enzyme [Bacteroidota bacterium]
MSKLIYLDNSATSFPKPDVVYDFMCNFYREHGVNPGRSGFDAAIETGEVVFNTRRLLTELFNGDDPNRLTFSYNATDSLNLILCGLINKGDHVITTNLEHNSVLRPLYHMSIDGLADVSYIPFDENGYVHPDDIKKAIKKNTSAVVVNHCSNVLGTIQPVKEIGRLCREEGLLFIVDGSQSAGAVPVDVEEMGIDAFIFTGHKCLLGPTGIGGSYVRTGIDPKHTRYGGTGVRSAVKTHLFEFPYRLEAGTLNLIGVAGLKAGVEWLKEEGMNKIHEREMTLYRKLRDGLSETENVILYCQDGNESRNPVVSFNVEGFEAGDVGTMLDVDYEIACRTGLHCAPRVHEQLATDKIHGSVRFSIGPFNTEDHIKTAIEAVREIASIKK